MRNSNQEYQKKYMPEADVVPGRKVRQKFYDGTGKI